MERKKRVVSRDGDVPPTMAVSPGRPRLFIAVVGVVWVALALVEGVHLFEPFTYPYPPGRRPLGRPSPYRRSVHRRNTGDSGGDLTRLLGFRLGTGLFAEPRGDVEVWTDRRGYRNEPRLADTFCPVMITGDSFMDQGLTNADTPAGQLSQALGVPVYDHTHMARGPTTGVFAFLGDAEFRRKPPKVLVWGFVERSMHARRFPPYRPHRPRKRSTLAGALADAWQGLRLPATDRRSYRAFWRAYRDKWSMLRAFAVAIRAESVYRLEGRLLTDKVLIGRRPDGRFALFLRESVATLSRTARQRKLPEAADRIATVGAECTRRGIRLVVLLIPDKAHVYPHWLAPGDRPAIPTPDAPSALAALLERRGIHAVNLLPAFLAHNAADQPPLYYPDDTHWSERGITLAMHALAKSLRERGVRVGG